MAKVISSSSRTDEAAVSTVEVDDTRNRDGCSSHSTIGCCCIDEIEVCTIAKSEAIEDSEESCVNVVSVDVRDDIDPPKIKSDESCTSNSCNSGSFGNDGCCCVRSGD